MGCQIENGGSLKYRLTYGAIGCPPMYQVDFGGYLIARVTSSSG